MRVPWIAVSLLAALVVGGCGKDKSKTAPVSEDSSGGEDTGGAIDPGPGGWDGDEEAPAATPGIDEGTSEASSPWGATRAEQCRRPERPAMSSAALGPFDRGVRAARASNAAEAKREFEGAVNADPKAYPAHYNLGVLADRAGDSQKAMAHYRQALSIQPDYAQALDGIATIAMRRGDSSTAVSEVQSAAANNDTNLELLALYAEVLSAAGRHTQAWSAARKALKCDERHIPSMIALIKTSLAQGREELADSILEQALKIDANNAELHFLQGERLKDEPGRLRDALTAYERAVRLRPDFAEARMALGIQQLAGANYASALSHFEAAKALIPTQPAVHVNLGDAYRANKRWVDAKRAYDDALRIKERLPQAHYGLALIYQTALGDFPELDEIAALNKAIDEFKLYRSQMGSRLKRNDPSAGYIEDLGRQLKRAQRRLERDRERAAREQEEAQ